MGWWAPQQAKFESVNPVKFIVFYQSGCKLQLIFYCTAEMKVQSETTAAVYFTKQPLKASRLIDKTIDPLTAKTVGTVNSSPVQLKASLHFKTQCLFNCQTLSETLSPFICTIHHISANVTQPSDSLA